MAHRMRTHKGQWTFSHIASLCMIAVGCLVLSGWVLDIGILKSGLPGLQTMKANTAILFVLTGGGLWFLQIENPSPRQQRVAQIFTLLVILIGTLTLAEHIFDWNIGIDQVIVSDSQTAVDAAPGRPSSATAFNFVILGLSLLCLSYDALNMYIAQGLALIGFFIAVLALLGYIYGVDALYDISPFATIALHTTLLFIIGSLGVLYTVPDQGPMAVINDPGPAGVVARRLLPAALLIPPVVGWLRLVGQREGLYESEFGVALYTGANIIIFAVLVWWNARLLTLAEGERQQTGDALREIQARQAGIVESAMDAIITIDEDQRIVVFNHAAEIMFEIHAVDAIGQKLDVLIPPRYRSQHAGHIGQFAQTGVTNRRMGALGEISGLRRGGEEFPIEASISQIDITGKKYFTVILRDMTERMQAEEALRDSQARQAGIVESAMDAIITANSEQHIVMFNRAAEAMFQYKAESIIGEPLERLIPSRYHIAHREHIRVFGQAGVTTRRMGALGEISGIRADGEEFPIEASISHIIISGNQYFTVILRDVTERERADRALRESEERFRRAIVNAPIPILIHDENDRVLQLSKGWTNYSGYDQSDIPTMVDWTEKAYGERKEFAKDYIDDLFEMDQTVNNGEWVINTHDGSRRVWDFYTTPLITSSDQKRELLSIAVDVTDRKQAEEALRALNAELEARVAERTAHLMALNKELEAFSYSVSHDLRAPLRAMDGFGQALLEDYVDKLDDAGQLYIQRIRAASQRMGRLIDDLLQLSRLSRKQLVYAPVNLSELAHTIAKELQERAPERQVDFVIADGLSMRGDEGLLRAALTNLMNNAWKFTGQIEHTQIEFGITESDGRRVYFLRDNGVGFDMAYAGKLFGAFQRLHREEEFAGTGIGLATVQRIVHRHGGEIWAESSPDQGAIFYFTLQ